MSPWASAFPGRQRYRGATRPREGEQSSSSFGTIWPPIYVRENVVAPFAVRQKTFVDLPGNEVVMQPIEPQQMIGDSLRSVMFRGAGPDEKCPVAGLGEKEFARELLEHAVGELAGRVAMPSREGRHPLRGRVEVRIDP